LIAVFVENAAAQLWFTPQAPTAPILVGVVDPCGIGLLGSGAIGVGGYSGHSVAMGVSMQHAEEVQQDDDEDRHAGQPKDDVTQHQRTPQNVLH
jgi:hypothetical protein